MPATDVVTYEAARGALGLGTTDASYRDNLVRAITTVSQALDELCGPVVQRTITEVIDTVGHERSIRLSTGPVASITSVTFYDDGVPTVLTAETLTAAGGYVAELQQRIRPDGTAQQLSGVLRRRGTFADDAWDHGRVAVVYVAGRYANTVAAAGSRFEQAAILALEAMTPMITGRRVDPPGIGDYTLPTAISPARALPLAALDLVAADRIHLVGIA